MSTQFIRIQPVAFSHAAAILGEADRQPQYCSHVPEPEQPKWGCGGPEVLNARMRQIMDQPCPVRARSGKVHQRKRRHDFQCLLAGVISWPTSFSDLEQLSQEAREHERQRILGCFRDSISWLRRKYGDQLGGIVSHADEGHPHLHFFVVGACRDLHPGLRAEYVDGIRIASRTEKVKRYAAAMRAYLDEFHAEVGSKYGLARSIRPRSLPRIRDRGTALRVLELEKQVQRAEDTRALEQLMHDAHARDHQRARIGRRT